jgi:GT2 family glycosyltransferase
VSPHESFGLGPIKIVDIEVGRGIEALEGLDGYAAVQGLVRLNERPLGVVDLAVQGGRCPAETVARAIAAQQPAALQPEGQQPAVRAPARASVSATARAPETLPSVTVAVCTRDHPDDLALCLDSLQRVEHPGLELLIVDNAPTNDATERLVRSRHPATRYVRELRPGLDWARNRAIAEARGEILAFTDDDVIVDPAWARALASAFAEDPAVMAVTGPVVPYELETDAQILFERYRSFARGFARRRVQADPASRDSVAARYGRTGDFGTGANMAFRRSVFDQIGPFDPALDVGTVTNGGGDLEMFFRVLKAGHALVYEPRALVRHRHRRTMEELRRQITDQGIGFSAYVDRSSRAHPEERQAFARVRRWWFAKTFYRLLRPRAAPAGALRALSLAELRGLVLGLRRYPRAAAAAARLRAAGGDPYPNLPSDADLPGLQEWSAR